MDTGTEGRVGTDGIVEAALQADAGVARPSIQAAAETAVAEQAPAAAANALPDTATPVPAENAGTGMPVRSAPEPAAGTSAAIDPGAASPSATPAVQVELTASGGSDTSVPSYGRQTADGFSAAYGIGETASAANPSFLSQGAGEAAPVIILPDPSPAAINDMITARVIEFVEEINAVLSAAQDEAAAQGEGVSADEAHQALPATGRSAHAAGGHTAFKQVLADMDGLQGARSIGISVEKDGLLHLDTRLLSSKLSSGKEETLAAARSVANTVSDKVDALANALAAAYTSYNRMPQMRAVHGGAQTPSPEQEMTQEQGRLEQRLTELRLLIEKSEFLTKWLQGQVSDDAEFPEDAE
jgi:hypothetical protein